MVKSKRLNEFKDQPTWIKLISIVGLIMIVFGLFAAIAISASFLLPGGLNPGVPGDTTPASTAIKTISYQDGEDVSNFLTIDTYHPDYTSDFDPTDEEDLRPDSLTGDKWERDIDGKDVDDVELDLTSEEYQGYFYIEIDPDGDTVFSNNHHLCYGGSNGILTIYVYDLSSDVYFTNFDQTSGTNAIPTSDGNYSLSVTGFPIHTSSWSNKHVGDDWETSSDDYDEMSLSEKEEYLDEENWCIQAPTYSPEDDTDKDYEEGLERYTNVFSWKFQMNDTISTVDGNVKQVNVTLDDISDDEVETVISGQYLYIACARIVDVGFDLDYEIEFGANITCSNIYGGRLTVPDDDNTGLSYSAYSFSMS
jgi:hypothetical protein